MDKDLRYTFWNKASEELIGIKEEDAIGKSIYDIFGSDNQAERTVKFYKNVLATKKPGVFENRYHLCGKDYLFEINVYPTKEGVSVFCKDITNKKKAEEELKRKLMKFKIEEGSIYLVEEPSLDLSLNAFEDLIKVGYKGVIISRASKEELKIKEDAELWWLAESVKDSIKPDVDLIKDKIEKLPEKSAVLIDRLDYLITKNSFEEILSFVQNVKEIAYMNELVIIFSIDSSILDEKQMRFFQKECRQIQPRELIRLPEDMLEILRVIYKHNSMGSKPSLTELGKQLGLSKPTIRKDIGMLQSLDYLLESQKGRQKVVELTDKGRNLFIG